MQKYNLQRTSTNVSLLYLRTRNCANAFRRALPLLFLFFFFYILFRHCFLSLASTRLISSHIFPPIPWLFLFISVSAHFPFSSSGSLASFCLDITFLFSLSLFPYIALRARVWYAWIYCESTVWLLWIIVSYWQSISFFVSFSFFFFFHQSKLTIVWFFFCCRWVLR